MFHMRYFYEDRAKLKMEVAIRFPGIHDKK
jgi:hypothetical protein